MGWISDRLWIFIPLTPLCRLDYDRWQWNKTVKDLRDSSQFLKNKITAINTQTRDLNFQSNVALSSSMRLLFPLFLWSPVENIQIQIFWHWLPWQQRRIWVKPDNSMRPSNWQLFSSYWQLVWKTFIMSWNQTCVCVCVCVLQKQYTDSP